MQTWAISYDNSNYVVRGDNGDLVFSDYNGVVKFAKSLQGEHKFFDLPTEGVIELYHSIVVRLDSHASRFDNYLMGYWSNIK